MKTRIAYWSCQAIGWGAYSIAGIAMAAQSVGWRASLIIGYALFFCYSIALTDLLRREMLRRQWLNDLNLRALGRMFGAAVVLGVVQTFLVFAIDFLFHGRAGMAFHNPGYAIPTWISVTATDCLWLLFYVAVTAFRLGLALREAELRVLEAQINPHFLFNCLNSIRALVVENPPLAQDMITRFASILRYNLHRDLKHTVPLAEEVNVVNDYLALEAVRLEDRLRVELSVDEQAGKALIPPMLLQTLVENAVKHGISTLPDGGELQIRARADGDRLIIEVINTGRLAVPKPGSSQVGLANTRERLRILYGSRASVELKNRDDGCVAATVLIPRTV